MDSDGMQRWWLRLFGMASPGRPVWEQLQRAPRVSAQTSNGSRGSLVQALPSPLSALHHKGRANELCAYLIKSGIAQTKTESLTLDEGGFFYCLQT